LQGISPQSAAPHLCRALTQLIEPRRSFYSSRRTGPAPLARSNAAQCETHIRRPDRKRFNDAVAVVRSVAAAAIRALNSFS